MLTKERILELFDELNTELCELSIRGDVFIVGGAAMAVAYDARPALATSLATKLMASRVSRDEDDILTLYDLCGLTTVDQGLDLVERYYGSRPIETNVQYFLEELLARRPATDQ